MKQLFALFFSILFILNVFASINSQNKTDVLNLYNEIFNFVPVEEHLNPDVFYYAMLGYNKLLNSNSININKPIMIIDFTKESIEKRLFVIDLDARKLLYNTWVAHGKNSGLTLPTSFSNVVNSYKSSLGFYVIGELYEGPKGLSVVLHGQEEGYNSNAQKRAIIMHGADYVGAAHIEKWGRLGRSLGCPAIEQDLVPLLLPEIAEGAMLFIYSDKNSYLLKSKFLRKNFIQ